MVLHYSWKYDCQGGCVALDARGEVLAKANRAGREVVLLVDLAIPARIEPKRD
jgi:hypothetical protein